MHHVQAMDNSQSNAELVRVAAEWTHLATNCGRQATAWIEQGKRWSLTGENHLGAAGRRAQELAEHAREMASSLREAARELLDAVARD
jgi:hypothetical protein